MDAYTTQIITGIIRVLIFFFLLFIVLPRLLFGGEKREKHQDNTLTGIVLLSGFSIVIVYSLSLVKIYDLLSLGISFIVFSGIFILSGEQIKNDAVLSRINFMGLRILEQNITHWLRERLLKKDRYLNEKVEEYSIIWKIMLSLVLLFSGFIRFFPVFRMASPFSIEAYKNLEIVKALEDRGIYYYQIFVPKGMHALIDIVYQFTRVNPQTLIHIFGAISAMILVGLIYVIVFRITRNRPASLISAAIFGVFPRILPVSLESQVEANALLLCGIFIVLGIYLFIEYVHKPSLYTFVTFIMGVMAAILINLFAVVVLGLFIPVFALAFLIAKRKEKRKFLRRTFSGLIFMLFLIGFNFVYQKLDANPLMLATMKSIVRDDSFMRFAHDKMIFGREIFFYGSILLGFISLIFVAVVKNTKLQLHYLVWGLTTIVLTIFWYGEQLGIALDLNRMQLAFVLAVFVCINFGLVLYGMIFWHIENHAYEEEVIPLRVTVSGLIIVLVLFEGLLLAKAPAIAKFQYQTEPDGYVRAIYEIEKSNAPYEWMVVSHFGAKVQVEGYGRYMDYLYFLKYFSPEQFTSQARGVIPAKFLYIFTEKDSLNSRVDTAFLPKIKHLNKKMNRWCEQFAQKSKNIKIFYEDAQVRIYEIIVPQTKKTILKR